MRIVGAAFVLFILCFMSIVYRLFVIQIAQSKSYIPLEKYLRVERALSLRGEILDINNIPMAVNAPRYELYIDTQKVRENEEVQQSIIKVSDIEEASMSAVLAKKNWQKIGKILTPAQRDALKKWYPTYINTEEVWVRQYPEGSRSAHLLGFVGRDDVGNPQGYIGVEGYFEQELKGLPSVQEREEDMRGVSLIGGVQENSQGAKGITIQLTIDSAVQVMMEKELMRRVEQFDAKYGCAIIMKPEGPIVGMGCVPAFNPEEYANATPEAFINPLVSTVYEPGSTFKPLVVAMAMEKGKIKPTTRFDEKGPVKVGEYSIKTWNNQYHGNITVSEILEQSSNVGMVHIINTMKRKDVSSYMQKLGLTDQTGIELQGEALPLIRPMSEWKDIDYATLSFGQGMAITPVQLAVAFSSLANGGYATHPVIIETLRQEDGTVVRERADATGERVFSQKTVTAMQDMLHRSVEHSEAKYPGKPEGYYFCGKTGTAQIPIEGHYDPNKTIASFIGFFPCKTEQPRLLMLVIFGEPKGSIWGSETAAPAFFSLAKQLVLYYNIAPYEAN